MSDYTLCQNCKKEDICRYPKRDKPGTRVKKCGEFIPSDEYMELIKTFRKENK